METQFLFVWSAFFCITKADYPVVDLPDPHLVILSPVNVDSTSLANVLLGSTPNCQDCLTNVSPNDTKTPCSPKYAVGDWADTTIRVSLFQASCFGEPGGYERVKNAVDVVKNFVKTNNRFLIVLNSSIHKTQDSFDTNLDQVLSQFGALFGREFWSRTVLGATNWHFDIDSVVARNRTGKNEEWWTEMMSNTIKQRFGVTVDMSAVFIDADAKLPSNVNDPLQLEAFQIENEKLLGLMRSTISMEMITLEEQTDELNKIINNTLTDIQDKLDQLTTDIVEVQDDIIDNGIDISNVKGAVTLNQIEIEKQDKHINEINGNITQFINSDNYMGNNFIRELIITQGFECNGDTVVTIPGNITSANYPANYPTMYNVNLDCSFTLVPQPGHSVNLQFDYFRTESSSTYLEITPFGNSTSKYDTTTVPPTTTYEVDQLVTLSFRVYGTHMYDLDALYRFKAMFNMV